MNKTLEFENEKELRECIYKSINDNQLEDNGNNPLSIVILKSDEIQNNGAEGNNKEKRERFWVLSFFVLMFLFLLLVLIS